MASTLAYELTFARPAVNKRVITAHDLRSHTRLEIEIETEPEHGLTGWRATGLLTGFAAYLCNATPPDLLVEHCTAERPLNDLRSIWKLQVNQEPVIIWIRVNASEDLALTGEAEQWGPVYPDTHALQLACLRASWKFISDPDS